MEPKTHKEHYLAKIAGEDVTIPEPKTPQEHYLKKIAENDVGSGYTVEETRTVIIPEQTVTTVTPGEEFSHINGYSADVTNSTVLPETFPDTILMTADGVEYTLPKIEFDSTVVAYGEIVDMRTIDWSNYPAQVMCIKMYESDQWTVFVVTETAGTYTVKAESVAKFMTVSPEFQEAVAKSTEPLILTCEFTSYNEGTHNSTAEEIDRAIRNHREIIASAILDDKILRLKMQYAVKNGDYYIAMFVAVDVPNNVMFVTNTLASTPDNNRFFMTLYNLTPAT